MKWLKNLKKKFFPSKEEQVMEIVDTLKVFSEPKEIAPVDELVVDTDGGLKFQEYLATMRKHRGKLTDMDDKIYAIFSSQEDFAKWMVDTKILGINKAYEYTQTLNEVELDSLTGWIHKEGVRNTQRIEKQVARILTWRTEV